MKTLFILISMIAMMNSSEKETIYQFQVKDIQGNDFDFSSLKGKKIMVVNTASKCGLTPQYEKLEALYEKYKDKNFTVFGVSLDRAKDPWLKAIKDDNLTWAQVSDLKFWNNAVAVQYKIQSIPQNFLIDPNGIIVAKNLRGEELQTRLAALLSK